MSVNEIKNKFIKKIDLRGNVCPMNFVYTKVALEDMHKGEILEVLIDFCSAKKSIPDSCLRQDLAKLLNVEEFGESKKYWKLILQKL
ncbi:MAG: sulfurtransferase TusA family protein [Promethearchaeota archaeon]